MSVAMNLALMAPLLVKIVREDGTNMIVKLADPRIDWCRQFNKLNRGIRQAHPISRAISRANSKRRPA